MILLCRPTRQLGTLASAGLGLPRSTRTPPHPRDPLPGHRLHVVGRGAASETSEARTLQGL